MRFKLHHMCRQRVISFFMWDFSSNRMCQPWAMGYELIVRTKLISHVSLMSFCKDLPGTNVILLGKLTKF